ncbi:hypothetical protein A2Z56_02585 [Candidatus Kaiserbacteria bacterium RIFCSPHIGHO2_12_45_16]|nr:MAG: hypothetical protein A2Z56_02585 [Candidatus Kaiserbacteria bacterium RIFCSPHIGHO2_12_45_16]
MITTKFEDRADWLDARRGRITGSRLKNLIVKRGSEMKKGYYEIIAERLSVPEDPELPMDRGTRLESEAIALFVEETGKKINTDLVIWERDDNSRIAVSPDGFTEDEAEAVVIGSIGTREAVEVKCLNSADHIKAFITKEIPDDYDDQVIQYFTVNEKLERLYFVMYDPRMSVHSFFYLVIERADVEEKVKTYLAQQQNMLATIEATIIKLTGNLF